LKDRYVSSSRTGPYVVWHWCVIPGLDRPGWVWSTFWSIAMVSHGSTNMWMQLVKVKIPHSCWR
jgi:hypothetical protein